LSKEKERMFFCVLKALRLAKKPLGSNSLAGILEREGFRISAPSISRLLVTMEREGYLIKQHSNRGRLLSPKGEDMLDELIREREKRKIAADLIADVNEESPEKLLDLLIARRALEREAVRLAARNASARDIDELIAYAEILDEVIRSSEHQHHHSHVATLGEKFHDLIAYASKNSFLISALDLIGQNLALRNALWSLAEQQESASGDNHLKIAEAIQNRDPEGAEQAVIAHINTFVDLIQQQIARRNEKNLEE